MAPPRQKAGFGVDDPLVVVQRLEKSRPLRLVRQAPHVSMKRKRPLVDGLFQIGEALLLEQRAEHSHRKEEALTTGNPSLTIWREAATGDDTVDMGMMVECLSPGVEDGEKTDLGTQMLGVTCDGLQGFGHRAEEDTVYHFFVLQRHGAELVRKGEYGVVVFHRFQEILGASLHPLRSCGSLTLGAMAIAAGVVADVGVTALVALPDMPTERRGTAQRDVP